MWRTLAVALAVFSSVAAMGQQKSSETDWMKDFTSRITLNGYAQGGWSYQDLNDHKTNSYNLKRTLLWAKARITDRWSFMFMHDFSSVVQEYYTDYRISNDKSLTVRIGQFKHSYTMENDGEHDVTNTIGTHRRLFAGCALSGRRRTRSAEWRELWP